MNSILWCQSSVLESVRKRKQLFPCAAPTRILILFPQHRTPKARAHHPVLPDLVSGSLQYTAVAHFLLGIPQRQEKGPAQWSWNQRVVQTLGPARCLFGTPLCASQSRPLPYRAVKTWRHVPFHAANRGALPLSSRRRIPELPTTAQDGYSIPSKGSLFGIMCLSAEEWEDHSCVKSVTFTPLLAGSPDGQSKYTLEFELLRPGPLKSLRSWGWGRGATR
eukprot:scaffold460_cov445-Prasinococcus_capsulatus_cf.AAC.3